jgi:hypothetical protein
MSYLTIELIISWSIGRIFANTYISSEDSAEKTPVGGAPAHRG